MLNRAGARIAVVEDEEPVRTALGRLLRSAGYVVDLYPSGEDFLAGLDLGSPSCVVLDLGSPACVVLDLWMPGVDGHAVQTRLAEEWPTVPVVVVTGCGSPADRARARRAGAVVVLEKPVDESDLLAAVGSAVDAA